MKLLDFKNDSPVRIKNVRAGLNFWATDSKFLQVVGKDVAYNL